MLLPKWNNENIPSSRNTNNNKNGIDTQVPMHHITFSIGMLPKIIKVNNENKRKYYGSLCKSGV